MALCGQALTAKAELRMTSQTLNILSAAAVAGSTPPAWLQFLPLVAMVAIFWLLILRPQMRRQKEHQAKLGALKKGDQVITAGGLLGKIIGIDDDYVTVELGPNMKVKAVKSTITDVISPVSGKPAND
jgi:preprotein translocase subunit YajC